MKNLLKRNSKEPNKFAGKRQYKIRTGLPEKTLTRLNDLYELLQCDPDDHGYVVTTFKEMNELTQMDVNVMTTMVHNGMLQKANTGGTPKFKYKWDTIKPTMDMAVKLLDKKLEMTKKKPDDVVSESKPENKTTAHPEDTPDYVPGLRVPELSSDISSDKSIILESSVNDGIMTAHVNLEKLGITEAAVLNAILAIDRE